MNGQSTVNYPTNNNNNNEQLIGKFHVVHVDKLPTNSIGSHDETTTTAGGIQQLPPTASSSATNDESASASRFQMIRVDRSFARGRWKVNDYEPPENTSIATNPPVNTIENEPVNISNSLQFSTIPSTSLNTLHANIPPGLSGDSNATSSATLAATAASAAAAAATAFQQQHQQQQQQQQQQQRLALTNPATVIPTANVPPPTGLLHGYPPGALANMAAPNQPYMLPNHPQFGYYPFFPPHYSHYAAQWAALAAANPYLPPSAIPPPQQQSMSQLPTGNLGDLFRHMDSVPDVNSENPMISSNPFPNSATDHLQNAQMAAAASFIYAAHHPHSTYVTQPPPNTASPYATIASYHPVPPPPTIIPPTQPLSLAQLIPNNTIDIQQQQQQQSHQVPQSQQQQQQQQQHAPTLTSPKHDVSSTKTPLQQSTVSKTGTTTAQIKPPTTLANGINIDTLKPATAATNPSHITDLLSSSPSILNSQQLPPSLLSPITAPTTNSNNNNNNSPNKAPATSLNDIWTYTSNGSPLNLSQAAAQTAAVTAVAAMGLLNNENGKGTEMAHEIFKELTTPTKPNNITDIDNKISAAMDLVKVHLLSAVREEVTELRQQIRTLNEKVNSVEHENTFLRQHVPSEIYAQYTPLPIVSAGANDSNNPMATVSTTATNAPLLPPSSSIISSQAIPMASLSSFPSYLAQQPSSSTTSQAAPQLPPPPPPPSSSTTNLPPT